MSKKSVIQNIVVGILLTCLSAWVIASDFVFGLVATIIFGSMSVFFITRYWKFRGERSKKLSGNSEMLKDLNNPGSTNIDDGIFSFNDQNFTVPIDKTTHTIEWKRVKTMVAYKIDRFASDDICLDVFCDGNINFTISEETAGWLKFLDNSKVALPDIDKFWEIEIAAPAFATNTTIVYDQQCRTLKEIEKEYYSN